MEQAKPATGIGSWGRGQPRLASAPILLVWAGPTLRLGDYKQKAQRGWRQSDQEVI